MSKKCKRICKLCEHFLEDSDGVHKCEATAEEKVDCVDGHTFTSYKLCREVNTDGSCLLYKEDKLKAAKEKLKKAIDNLKEVKRQTIIGYDYCHNDLQNILLSELEETLHDNYDEGTYHFYTEYEDGEYELFARHVYVKLKDGKRVYITEEPKEYVR